MDKKVSNFTLDSVMADAVPAEIKAYLAVAGFSSRSETLFTNGDDFKQYLLYVTKEGMFSLEICLFAPNEPPFKKTLFSGYEVKSLEQIKFLVGENLFFSSTLPDKVGHTSTF